MTQKFLKTKKSIIGWLDKYNVANYTLIPDSTYGYLINTTGGVDLSNKDLTHLPVKFNHVKEYFDCMGNQLTTLEFSPHTVGGRFDCSTNRLVSLEGCPHTVGGSFYCFENQLTSLEHCPQEINGLFHCARNKLTSLEFCPREISMDFYCGYNEITSLEFCPEAVGYKFHCSHNELLGEAQNIQDFNEIYKIHKTIVQIKKEKEILGSLVQVNSLSTKPASTSFKI